MKANICKKIATIVMLVLIAFLFSFMNVVYAEGEEEKTTLTFSFDTNSNDENQRECINEKRTQITYKKYIGWNEQEGSLYADVKVSLIKGEEAENDGQKQITENEVCTLDYTYYYNWETQEQFENNNIFRYEFNQKKYDGYYLKVESNMNDNLSIRYNYGSNEDNHNGHFNVQNGINVAQEGIKYISVSEIMQEGYRDVGINGIDNKYEDLKAVFSGYTGINNEKNKLTYRYNNNGNEENVYVEFIQYDDWVWNQQLNEGHGEFERIENIPMTLKEENGKYSFDFNSQNHFSNYYIRLSFDENSNLEGQVCLTINGKRKEFDSYWDNEQQKDITEPNKITLWEYDRVNNIEISKICSMFGDVAVDFEEITMQGRKIAPTKNCYNEQTEQDEEDENIGVRYNFENNESYEVNICERPENNDNKSWPTTRFKLSEGLKLFSDRIQNGDYRVSLGNRNEEVYLIVNDRIISTNEMEEVKTYYWEEKKDNQGNPILDEYGNSIWEEIESDRTEKAYIIKPEDVQNGKISIKIGFDYSAKLSKDIEVSNNGKTAQITVGRDEEKVKMTFATQDSITKKVEEFDDWKDEYYAITFKESEISDKLISLDNNFNSNTMEIGIFDYGMEFILPVYEENGKQYVKLTDLKRTIEENGEQKEEPYYFTSSFHLDIRMKGSGGYVDVPLPDIEKEYFTIGAIVDEGAEGEINYYFLKKVGDKYVYLDNQGNVLEGNKAAGSVTEFQNGEAKIKYAPGTEYMEIKVKAKNDFTEPTNIRLFVDGAAIERVNVLDEESNETGENMDVQDLFKYGNGRIEVNSSQLEFGMGMTVYFAYEPREDVQNPHILAWSNDKESEWNAESLIDGGKAYLREAYRIEENGNWTKIYDRVTDGDKSNKNIFAVNQNSKGGEVEAVEGIKLVFEFKPNYGKQLVDLKLGNEKFELGKNQRYFEFIMPLRNEHFSATFKDVENTTSGDYKNNTTYKLSSNISKIIESGTLDLLVKDVTNTLNAEQKKGFANVEGTKYNVAKYLELNLYNIWYKGEDNTTTAWTEPIYNLGDGNEVEITLKVPDGLKAKDVVILHEEYDGSKVIGYKKITPTSYNEKNNTVTFKTSKFSNFAIASKAHEHAYKSEITKATLSKDGCIVTKCACGNVSKKTTIYYPKTISLSKIDFTYNKKTQKPTVTVKDSKGKIISASNYTVTYSNKDSKKIGKYTVTVKFKGNYTGTKNLTYYINPKGTTISKITAKSKGFKTEWKTQKTETTGYEIQYSTNKKFSSGNKTVTVKGNSNKIKKISNLKVKKTYYVRIRTYKTVSGKKYYSVWSGYKKVTTKK